MINVGRVLLRTSFAQKFSVNRTSGAFVDGIWTANPAVVLQLIGVIVPTSARTIHQLPEGDRVSALMSFYSREQIYTTQLAPQASSWENTAGSSWENSEGSAWASATSDLLLYISDQILWDTEYYKVVNVMPFKDYGFYEAVAQRIKGY